MSWKTSAGIITALAIFASSIKADEIDDQQAEYRQNNGMYKVVWMKGLLNDYHADVITEAELMKELWSERPDVMAQLYQDYGSFTLCFELDLIISESNGVIQETNGTKIFFDTAQYRDQNGDIISGYESVYNTATRANRILNDAYVQFGQNCFTYPPMNNKCCGSGLNGLDRCKSRKNKRCKMDLNNQWCVTGSTACG